MTTTNTVALRAIGDTLVLHGRYDPAQLWLPFVHAVLVIAPPPPPDHNLRRLFERTNLRSWAKQRYATIPTGSGARQLYHDEEGVPQHVLPYPGRLHISGKQASKMGVERATMNFERRNGDLAQFAFDRTGRAELLDWCEINCRGRYMILGAQATFELWRDAALARLVVDPPP